MTSCVARVATEMLPLYAPVVGNVPALIAFARADSLHIPKAMRYTSITKQPGEPSYARDS